ncbi:MAG TPA: SDR family oxidoreductase [Acidimicrobiales bacterium]|jgi:NAD(P)-dependent dehydrogenase (short-subunit alcohol dehydrogenase family)|nr:SDR family oxidoreductase [Acidimicrobiales bacterium]
MSQGNDQMGGADRVVVVTGVGGMGLAIARRFGSGSTLVLADVNQNALASAADELRAEGYQVVERVTDVSDQTSVGALAAAAASLGRVEVLVHTAGVSPVQAPVEAVLRVDLLGTALMLDAFASVIAPGGAAVFIASMAGTMAPSQPELESRLATTPTAELLNLPELSPDVIFDPGTAYMMAKRANQVRVRAAALVWGHGQARVNSISPGIISTPMGSVELDGPNGEFMRAMVSGSPTGRLGTPHDIASAVEFLVGPQSSFITGTDLLVDGGVVAAVVNGAIS